MVRDVCGLHAQLTASAELTREQADAMLDAIPVAPDGRQLTREELAAEVAALTGIAGQDDKLKGGFGDLLKPAAFRGDLCFAPSDGRRVRFARPDQWLGPREPVPTGEATLEVARRYLARYGPADREGVEAEAEGLATFLGGKLELVRSDWHD